MNKSVLKWLNLQSNKFWSNYPKINKPISHNKLTQYVSEKNNISNFVSKCCSGANE